MGYVSHILLLLLVTVSICNEITKKNSLHVVAWGLHLMRMHFLSVALESWGYLWNCKKQAAEMYTSDTMLWVDLI